MSMADPRHIAIRDYSYSLPDDRIANYPLEERDASKLLVYREGSIHDTTFLSLPEFLSSGDLLVFNETKVIHARLIFKKPTGSTIEILCLEPHDMPDPAVALRQQGSCTWKVMIGNRKRWKEAYQELMVDKGDGSSFALRATIYGEETTGPLVQFSWEENITFAEVIELAGKIPLPPYFKREPETSDEERYQTVYARHDGSVAAPTAGLHFTPRVLDALAKKNIDTTFVTLHVGAGTFRPVKSELLEDHVMHEERIVVSRTSILRLLRILEEKNDRPADVTGKIVAVGTTSMRTLESLYWMGVKLLSQEELDKPLTIDQWYPYEKRESAIPPAIALNAIADYLAEHQLSQLVATTGIIIAPGYTFRMVDVLITNFHQPDSTLLLLVAAFTGPDWRRIYDHALANAYRFLSYGDSSVLFRNLLNR